MDSSDNTFIVLIHFHAPRVRLKMASRNVVLAYLANLSPTFKCIALPL